MTERIYNLVGNGDTATLNEFQEQPFDDEDALQELIARNPELLAGEQMNPGDPPRWILITREAGIADQVDGAARWSLDHALIDQHAVPTLVETKRGDNREIRRPIVGQMLDYAAHASRYWTAAELREKFEEQEDADLHLSDLLDQDEPDPEEFWNLVETNLSAKNLRLLFVADRVPDELATVVEFLNEQMPRIEVLAVEIKQFRGDSGLILVPRVIGRVAVSERSTGRGRARHVDRERFFSFFDDSEVRGAFERTLEFAEVHGGEIAFTENVASVRARCATRTRALTIAWLRTPKANVWGDVTDFAVGYPTRNQTYSDEIQKELTEWIHSFAGVLEQSNNRYEELRRGSYTEFIENEALIRERLGLALDNLATL